MVDVVVAMVDTSKYTVLQTRPLDSNIHRHNRIELAKKFRTDLLLSFHCNAHTNKSWNGTEIHISDSTVNVYDSSSKSNPYLTQNIKIAAALSKNISTAFPLLKNNGTVHRKDRIWIIYACTFPSAIIEWGYISNAKDIKIMQDSIAQKKLATTVWQAIDEYFEVNKTK